MEVDGPSNVEVESNEHRLNLIRKIANWFHRLNVGRYEEIVPQEIRDLAESEGIPKPNRYVP